MLEEICKSNKQNTYNLVKLLNDKVNILGSRQVYKIKTDNKDNIIFIKVILLYKR